MFFYFATIILLVLLYIYGTRNFSYWKIKGIKHDHPIPFFGNNFKQLTFRVVLCDVIRRQYEKYSNERFVGFYFASQKVLIPREPGDIQRILATDFGSFYLRGLKIHSDEKDTFFNNLVMAEGDTWKLLRQRMTPAFTSGKLRAMFPLIVERAEKLQKLAGQVADTPNEVDLKELLARYTTDVVGAVGFGIDPSSLDNENSEFRRLGRRIFKIKLIDILRKLLKISMPLIFKNLDAVAPEIKAVTTGLVLGIMKERNFTPSSRNDFIDLMLRFRMKGKMTGQSIEKRNPDGTSVMIEKELDDSLMVAQVFTFFAAGFEASSSTSSFALHQLAFHPEIQTKCQEEIDAVLEKYDNKLCYDAIPDLKYLTMTLKESMRLFPSIGILFRQAAAKYTFPDSDLTIDEGVRIIIPTHAIHMDEKFFPEPNKFKPERFSPENIHTIHKYTYFPFGDGPRACIGSRLGLIQALAGLVAILSKFTVVPSKSTKRQPVGDPSAPGLVQTMKGGNPLLLISRNSSST